VVGRHQGRDRLGGLGRSTRRRLSARFRKERPPTPTGQTQVFPPPSLREKSRPVDHRTLRVRDRGPVPRVKYFKLRAAGAGRSSSAFVSRSVSLGGLGVLSSRHSARDPPKAQGGRPGKAPGAAQLRTPPRRPVYLDDRRGSDATEGKQSMLTLFAHSVSRSYCQKGRSFALSMKRGRAFTNVFGWARDPPSSRRDEK